MNQQREVIYKYRDRDPRGRGHVRAPRKRADRAACSSGSCDEYTPGDFVEDWDIDGPVHADRADLRPELRAPRTSRPRRSTATSSPSRAARGRAARPTSEREEELGEELMRNLERFVLLQIIDERWREHLHDMDYLREGIHLRGFAQKDPLVEYKNEGFDDVPRPDRTRSGRTSRRYIFHVEVEIEAGRRRRWRSTLVGSARRARRAASATPAAAPEQPSRAATTAAEQAGAMAVAERRRRRVRRAARGRDAPRRRADDRPQRPVLVRLGQEVQEVPRRIRWPSSEPSCPARRQAPRPAEAARGLPLTPLS